MNLDVINPTPERLKLAARLQAKSIARPSGCIEWTGGKGREGYGHFVVNGKDRRSHMVSYELFVGPVPKGLELHHSCENKACVNPAHLEPLTNSDHQKRHRKSHCKNGHEFTEENTRFSSEGRRYCKTCAREKVRRYQATHDIKARRREYQRRYMAKFRKRLAGT